jgi:hypothetical protein
LWLWVQISGLACTLHYFGVQKTFEHARLKT